MKPDVPNVLIAGPVNVRASLEQALGERGVRVHGCSFPDLIATCAGSSPRLVVLAGSMKGVELNMAATALAEHAATRAIPVVILTGEPGAPPARRPDAAPLTLVLSHQGLPAVATRLADLAASVPMGAQGGVIAEPGGSSKSGREPRLDDRLSPFLVGEPTEDTGSGPIRALHLHAPIANEPADPLTRSRDWTWEDSPQGTTLTDDNDDQKAAKQRRLARTMMGVAPQGLGPSASDGASSGGEDGDMPAPAASRAGAWGSAKSDSVAPTAFPPARPLARAALRKAEPSTVGPLPGSDEEQAPVISPIVGPPRTAKPRPKTMLGVGLPSPAGAPAPAKPAGKPRPRTMLGLGLGAAGAPAPAANPATPTSPSAPTPASSAEASSTATAASSPATSSPAASSPAETSQQPSSPGTVASPAMAAPPKRTPKFTPSAPMPAARPKSSGSLPAVRGPAVTPAAMPAVTAAAASAASAATPAKSELPARKTGSPGPRRSANRTIMGGMGSPLAPPPPVNLPPSRPDDTAVVPTESDAPSPNVPTGPAAAQFSSPASMDFTDEPTAVGDSAKQAAAGKASASSTQLAGADDFDDFDDFDLGLDHDEATQVLDQSSIAAAKLEALRAKSAQPDDSDFDTLPPPATPTPEPPPAVAAALANKPPNLDDDFESAETEPPPPGVGIDGRIPEASMSLTDALELEDFESDNLGRTLSAGESDVLEEGPVLGGAANPEPQPVRPQGYHQSFTGTEEDTEIVAGLTKKLDEREANPGKSSGRGWVLATVAIVGVIGVAGGAWYMAPTLLGTVAHSEDTVESTPVPAAGEVGSVPTPTPSEPPTTGTTTQAGLAAPPSGSEPPAAAPPAAEPPAPTVPEAPAPTVAEAPAPPVPTPPVPTPPAPSAATPPTPTPPAAVNTAGLPSDPAEASAALVTRAEQQAGAGDRAGAEASLRRALTLDDENYEAMAKLAEVLVASGQHEEALSLAQTAVRRRARVGRYHLIYGDVRAAMGDRSGASRSWSRAVDVDESLAAEAARRRSN